MAGGAPSLGRVRRAFDRAARRYDAAAVVAAETRRLMLERLDLTALDPAVIVDAGTGTGHAARSLSARYPRARVLALDASRAMLAEASRRRSLRHRFARVLADATRLPLADASVDLVFSNWLLPWVDADAVLGEFRRVLKPYGLLTMSGLGPDTLRELRAAWAGVDGRVRLPVFIDMHDLGDALVRAGFAAPVLDVERWTLEYPDLGRLGEDLGGVGARRFGAHLAALARAYEGFRAQGRLPATCEVVFAHAWGPAAPRSLGDARTPRETRVPLTSVGRRRPGA